MFYNIKDRDLNNEDKETIVEELKQIQQTLANQIIATNGDLSNSHIKRAERAVRAAIGVLSPRN